MLFAVTLVKNRRDSFIEDVDDLMRCLQAFKDDGYEVGYVGWEIQEDPKQHHCLHVHTTLSGHKAPYMMRYQGFFKEAGINWKLKDIPGKPSLFNNDAKRWYDYCKKNEHKDLAHIYSETHSIPKYFMF